MHKHKTWNMLWPAYTGRPQATSSGNLSEVTAEALAAQLREGFLKKIFLKRMKKKKDAGNFNVGIQGSGQFMPSLLLQRSIRNAQAYMRMPLLQMLI